MSKLVVIVGVIGVFLAALIAAYIAYDNSLWRFNYPAVQDYPIQGLDVSHHQEEIEWAQIDSKRYKFVFIKATEGGDFKDRLFQKNWKAAQEAGFKVGAYHFFTLCRPGADQANNFIDSVPNDEGFMPPVIDLEFVGNCSKRPDKNAFEQDLKEYITAVEKHYGQKPVLYTTYDFFGRYLAGTPYQNYPLWLRDIFAKPQGKWDRWAVWQYADNANVAGINGRVDLNVMREEFYNNLSK